MQPALSEKGEGGQPLPEWLSVRVSTVQRPEGLGQQCKENAGWRDGGRGRDAEGVRYVTFWRNTAQPKA